MSQPNDEIGMEDIIMLSFEPASSGDELLMSLRDPQEIEFPTLDLFIKFLQLVRLLLVD